MFYLQATKPDLEQMLNQSTNVSQTMGTYALYIILGMSLVFLILCISMTVFMLRRRSTMNVAKKDDGVLIRKYQDFLSNFLILPIDESFIGIGKSADISQRLDRKDISDPHCRKLLANEIYDLKKQLCGQQAIQLNNYFFGLGLQEEVIQMLNAKKWSVVVRAMQMMKVFRIKEGMDGINKYINHTNKELSIHAITTRLDIDKNISVLNSIDRKLNDWEWHKIYHEMQQSKLAEVDFSALLAAGLQDPKSIEVIQKQVKPSTVLEPIMIKF